MIPHNLPSNLIPPIHYQNHLCRSNYHPFSYSSKSLMFIFAFILVDAHNLSFFCCIFLPYASRISILPVS
ncbi:hypothetical protein CW304_18920 [Bacillus sp. UFRGS-B20]|nr:hypothetical protein CW304_18920 [Bacillus sp. UFRGS-B20]